MLLFDDIKMKMARKHEGNKQKENLVGCTGEVIQCPWSIFHGGASLLKFLGRNSIVQFLTKTFIIHFAYFRVVLNPSLSNDMLFGMRTLHIIEFEPLLGFAHAHIHI